MRIVSAQLLMLCQIYHDADFRVLHCASKAVSVGSTRWQQSSYDCTSHLSYSHLPSVAQTLWHQLCANLSFRKMTNRQTHTTLNLKFMYIRLIKHQNGKKKTVLIKSQSKYLVRGAGKFLISCCSSVSLRMTCADIKSVIFKKSLLLAESKSFW